MKRKNNPELYEELVSNPYSSEEKAHRMIEGFWNELYALRKKYKVPNVVVAYQYLFREGDKTMTAVSYGNCGDSKLVLPMLETCYMAQVKKEAPVVDLYDSLVLLLASSGFGSVQQARQYIKDGNVKIDGELVTEDISLPKDRTFIISTINTETGEWVDFPVKQRNA